jgi:hydroxypyruvate reductase
VIAVGKAAGAMASGALDALGARLIGGRVILPAGHLPHGFPPVAATLRVLESAHPVPDERSLAAGGDLVDYVTGLPRSAQVLCLVSGGASSLVEAPLPGVELPELQHFNRWALGAGVPIGTVNALRRRLSRIKGGGLAGLLGERRAVALMISDVPGDDPRTIGSGLLHAGADDARACNGTPDLPADVAAAFRRTTALRPLDARCRRIPVRMVATLRQACTAAAASARSQGFDAKIARNRFAGDAAGLGQRFVRGLVRAPAWTVHAWGGESTVRLPDRPGRGGRNQHLALSAALALERVGDGWLLAAGTDGIDGASDDAGALVDAQTCQRGRDAGFDPHVSLAAADSGSFLDASGDLLYTGATLTNVGDLVLGLRVGGER